MGDAEIHSRVFKRHSQLTKEDILAAWKNVYYEAVRPESSNYPEYLWIGIDGKGREIEMVGTMTVKGWLIYHANTPLSKRVRREIGKRW